MSNVNNEKNLYPEEINPNLATNFTNDEVTEVLSVQKGKIISVKYNAINPNIEVSKKEISLEKAQKTISDVGNEIMNGNGDFVLGGIRTRIYLLIDSVGGVRQFAAITQGSAELAQLVSTATAASQVAHVAGVGTPVGLLITGPLVVGTGAFWIIPDSVNAYKEALEELEKAKKSGDPVLIKEAQHAVEVGRLGVANASLYTAMGGPQIITGLVTMMTPEVAKTLHYTPILTGHVALGALTGSNILLGAVYTARGSVMLYRSTKGYLHVREFEKELERHYKLDGDIPEAKLESVLSFLKKEEVYGTTYFGRRVDPSCLEIKDKNGKVIGKYTANGKLKNGTLEPYKSNQEKIEYLQAVDKGTYTQILKHKVAIAIAVAMILGGITAIILTILTGGLLPAIIIGIASAVFFASMEYIFFTYDSSRLFNGLRDKLYKENPHLTRLINELFPPEEQIDQSEIQVFSNVKPEEQKMIRKILKSLNNYEISEKLKK